MDTFENNQTPHNETSSHEFSGETEKSGSEILTRYQNFKRFLKTIVN
jgi:hypothetical protein